MARYIGLLSGPVLEAVGPRLLSLGVESQSLEKAGIKAAEEQATALQARQAVSQAERALTAQGGKNALVNSRFNNLDELLSKIRIGEIDSLTSEEQSYLKSLLAGNKRQFTEEETNLLGKISIDTGEEAGLSLSTADGLAVSESLPAGDGLALDEPLTGAIRTPDPLRLLDLDTMSVDEFFALDRDQVYDILRHVAAQHGRHPNAEKAQRIIDLLFEGKENYLRADPGASRVFFQPATDNLSREAVGQAEKALTANKPKLKVNEFGDLVPESEIVPIQESVSSHAQPINLETGFMNIDELLDFIMMQKEIVDANGFSRSPEEVAGLVRSAARRKDLDSAYLDEFPQIKQALSKLIAPQVQHIQGDFNQVIIKSFTKYQPGDPSAFREMERVIKEQLGAEFLGQGKYAWTFKNDQTQVLTKIFKPARTPEIIGDDITQMNFYKEFGGVANISKFIAEVRNEAGEIIGFQQEFIPYTEKLSQFLSGGGKFTPEEVERAIENLSLIHRITGQAHGDLAFVEHPAPIILADGRVIQGNSYTQVHTDNIIVQSYSRPDGEFIREIRFIDFAGNNRNLVRDPTFIQEEETAFAKEMLRFVKR